MRRYPDEVAAAARDIQRVVYLLLTFGGTVEEAQAAFQAGLAEGLAVVQQQDEAQAVIDDVVGDYLEGGPHAA